ncbi:MAG: hypothetical protein RSF40_08945 [Oscillospiraceae bacterium]
MAKQNRTCHVCGERYYYCSSTSCGESFDKPTWMVLFHDENCKNIWDAISDHFYKKISDEEAIDRLNKCDLSQRCNFNFSSDINKDLDDILSKQKSILEVSNEKTTKNLYIKK